MSIEEIMSEKRLIDDEIKDITNDLSYKRCRGEKIDDEYERDFEIKIKQLLQDYNGLDIEMQKKGARFNGRKILLLDILRLLLSHLPLPSYRLESPRTLIMGDEHLDTILEKESDKLIKSSVENLVPIPSESEDFSDNEIECDVPECDETSPTFTTFSNPLFDSNDDFTSSDDESLSDEDVPMENFKIYSNPLFDDEEIISPKIDPHYFNADLNLIESLLNRDILIDSSPKFDYLLEEFSGELAQIDLIPPGIEKADFDLEEEIRLVENLLYDNSSPRPPEKLNWEIADTILESLSPSLILVEDSDSHMEEIDLFLATDDSMPPGIEDDDYDSEGDIHFLEELLSNDSPPHPENESSNLDHFNDPSSPCPPPEPPDVKICFDFKPDTGVVTNKVVGDISEHDVLMPNLLPQVLYEFIKSSVEDLIPILRESEDTSGSDSESILPSSDDFSPIFEEISMTFSNPLFDSNDEFTSSDDESLSDEDVPEDVKIYSNPLEFDDEYISSDVNPLFDEVLEDIECEDSYDSNLDESTFLVTRLFQIL
ncbi:hypothetical protein Tco_0873960 [Tanacetum coccineum]|uniref:Uncharacterized protein n=1 Tax=Tanacetum coccineum TaxID=301880 RepID=A0ABQ5BPG6_9ASTR